MAGDGCVVTNVRPEVRASTAAATRTAPGVSKGRSEGAGASSGSVMRPSTRQSTPNGTLMGKTQCQPAVVTTNPPTVGPHMRPRETAVATTPRARPRSSDGNASVTMPMLVARANPAPTACTARAAMRGTSPWVRPHRREPTVNTSTPASKNRTLPRRSPRAPTTGMTAHMTKRYAVDTSCTESMATPSSRWMEGMATLTVDPLSVDMNDMIATVPSTAQRLPAAFPMKIPPTEKPAITVGAMMTGSHPLPRACRPALGPV